MKLIIAGSRTFENQLTTEDVDLALKKFKLKPTLIISGECKGPDLIGEAWAELNEIPISSNPAKWDEIEGCKTVRTNKWGKKYNYMAGFERNAEMAKQADALLVFWDGESPGTEDMIKCAKKVGIPVHYAKPDPEYVME